MIDIEEELSGYAETYVGSVTEATPQPEPTAAATAPAPTGTWIDQGTGYYLNTETGQTAVMGGVGQWYDQTGQEIADPFADQNDPLTVDQIQNEILVGDPVTQEQFEQWFENSYSRPYAGEDQAGVISGVQTQVAQDQVASDATTDLIESGLMVAATLFVGGLASGAIGTGAAGAAEGVAAGGAMDMGVGLTEVAQGFGAGEAAAAGSSLMPAAVAPPTTGFEATPFASASGAPATVSTLVNTEAAAAGMGLPPIVAAPIMPPATPETPPPGSTTSPFESSSGVPATVTTVNPAPEMIAPVGLVDKAIEWATRQIGTEAIKAAVADAVAPDVPAAPAAPAKAPFGFFGGMPWKAKTASAAPGLTRLSTGKSVFGSGALASPGGIVSNWMGRG